MGVKNKYLYLIFILMNKYLKKGKKYKILKKIKKKFNLNLLELNILNYLKPYILNKIYIKISLIYFLKNLKFSLNNILIYKHEKK